MFLGKRRFSSDIQFKLGTQKKPGDPYECGQHFIHGRLGYRGLVVLPYVSSSVRYFPAAPLPPAPAPASEAEGEEGAEEAAAAPPSLSAGGAAPLPLLRDLPSEEWHVEHASDEFEVSRCQGLHVVAMQHVETDSIGATPSSGVKAGATVERGYQVISAMDDSTPSKPLYGYAPNQVLRME
eukprot:gene15664-7629_t